MVKTKLKKFDTVEIQWIDSSHIHGWNKEKDLVFKKEFLLFRTVGFLLKETDYSYTVVQSHSFDEGRDGYSLDAIMEIPKVSVKKIKKL